MCELTTLMAVSLAASAAGAGVSAFGSYQQGRAQAAAARHNARIADQQAQQQIEQGRAEETIFREDSGRDLSRIEAAMAANGVDIGSGSAQALLSEYAEARERDALQIRENAEAVASTSAEQAAGFRSAASSAQTGGVLSAVGTALSGAGQVADRWYRYS